MIKNRYIWMSITLLAVMLIAVVLILPRLDSSSSGQAYVKKVFNQQRVTTVDITLDEDDLQSILDNPLAKELHPASVTINGETLDHVGIRTKGNSSLTSVARSDSDRYSFMIDFDYLIDDQTLHGLRKLALNNNFSDSTLMREYISYSLMEYMGVPTPAFSYMYVTINGKEWGLYLGVEAIDDPLLERTLGHSSGNLYKPDGTGSDLKWISDHAEDYSGMNLKTNKQRSDQSALIKMLDVINHGGNLQEVIDVDEILRYFAANTALVNLDSYQGSMKHNYYLYEEDGVFSILPWDYNMSFGGFGVGMGGGREPGRPADENRPEADINPRFMPPVNPDFPQIDQSETDPQEPGAGDQRNILGGRGDWNMGGGMNPFNGGFEGNMLSDSSINFSVTTPVSGTSLEDRPLLNALLSVEEYRTKFNEYLEDIAVNFFATTNIQSLAEGISATILKYVEQDPTKFSTTEQFLAGVSGDNSLIRFAELRAESIQAQLSGDLVVEADTNAGPFGGMPGNGLPPIGMEGGQLPNDMAPPDFGNGELPGNMAPPDFGNGEMPGEWPPGFVNGDQQGNPQLNLRNGERRPGAFPNRDGGGDNQDNQQANGQMGNRERGDNPWQPGRPGGFPGNDQQTPASDAGLTTRSIVLTSVLVLLLAGATVWVFLFQRRRYYRS